jgi:hypothetical protein
MELYVASADDFRSATRYTVERIRTAHGEVVMRWSAERDTERRPKQPRARAA